MDSTCQQCGSLMDDHDPLTHYTAMLQQAEGQKIVTVDDVRRDAGRARVKERRTLRMVELFAGVGGFRLGFERASSRFKTVWSNQWEPGKKNQIASDVYVKCFGSDGHSNQDISMVNVNDVPDHDILTAGFPCQDYSVARTADQAVGLVGEKGVLWWEIYRILHKKKNKPSYLVLENVDRLLKSPTKQRGRDLGVMLSSLNSLGYAVEWRVINAADYGMPQRRRRVFVIGYYRSTDLYQQIAAADPVEWIDSFGLLAQAFPVSISDIPTRPTFPTLSPDTAEVSEHFTADLENSGVMVNGNIYSCHSEPLYNGPRRLLQDVIVNEPVDASYYIDDEQLPKWEYLKGAKKIQRVSKATGFEYEYSEGPVPFPDPLDRPSRTVVTGEGGIAASRSKHVIRTADGRFRRLTPVELERLNMFPEGHTAGLPDPKRAFLMGNALVVGVVEKIARALDARTNEVELFERGIQRNMNQMFEEDCDTSQLDALKAMEDKFPLERTTAGNMPYNWGFSGPDGAWFVLHPESHHTDQDIQAAKAELYRDRDITSLRISRERS